MANKKRNNKNPYKGKKNGQNNKGKQRPTERYDTQRIREQAVKGLTIPRVIMQLPWYRHMHVATRNIGMAKVFAIKTSSNTNTGSTLQKAVDDINILLEAKLRKFELEFANAVYLKDGVDSYFANVIGMLNTYYAHKHWLDLPYAYTYTYLHTTLSEDKQAILKMERMLALTPRPIALDKLIHKLTVPIRAGSLGTIFAHAPQSGNLLADFTSQFDAIDNSFESELTAMGVLYGIPAPLPVGMISQDEGLFNALVRNVALTNSVTPASQAEVFPHALTGNGRVLYGGSTIDEIALYGFANFFNHATPTTVNKWEGLQCTSGGTTGQRALAEGSIPIKPLATNGTLGAFGTSTTMGRICDSYSHIIANAAAPGDILHSWTGYPTVSVPGLVSMEVRLREFLAAIFGIDQPKVSVEG